MYPVAGGKLVALGFERQRECDYNNNQNHEERTKKRYIPMCVYSRNGEKRGLVG